MNSIKSLGIGLALAAFFLTSPARAAVYNLDFTGTISNSTDMGGVLFGSAVSGGQNGLTVSGRFSFNSGAYADVNGSQYFGVYGPPGQFPQPVNLITSNITIGSQTFYGSSYMGPSSQHSLEFVSVQDIPPVNNVQQDIYWINDGSQKLLCSSPSPSSCNGGALGTSNISLKLYGITDFIGSDAMAQPLDLNASEIASIVGGPGGGQSNGYAFQEQYQTGSGWAWAFNAAGQFNLTSMRMYEVPAVTPVPEPEIYAMMGLGLGLMGWMGRRKRAQAVA